MNRVLVSVVVPVYQAGKYLHKCVDSILSQSIKEVQIILVDDGSRDESGKICDEYAGKDDRVLVVHQENRGVSAARNAGLREVEGEWVYFMDADDWADPNLLPDFISVLSEYPDMDIYKFGYFLDTHRKSKEIKDQYVHWVSDVSSMLFLNEKNGYFGFLWNMVVRRDLLAGLSFDEGLSWCEDHIYSFELFSRARKMYISNSCYYHHVQYVGESLSSALHDPYQIARVAEMERAIKYKCMGDCQDRNLVEMIEAAYINKNDLAVKNLYASGFSYAERERFCCRIGMEFDWKIDLKRRICFGFYFKMRSVYRFLHKFVGY